MGDPRVFDDDGELVEMPPARRDRAHELQLRDLDRQARHVLHVRARAYDALAQLSKTLVRELQDAEVLAVFLELLAQADGTDYRKGHHP